MIIEKIFGKYLFSIFFSFAPPLFILLLIFNNIQHEQNNTNSLSDIQGNVYKTIKIGNQVWMAENLKVTCYKNGDQIPRVQSEEPWSELTTGAYCLNEETDNYWSTYGVLYNYFVINDMRGVAPEGWHIPTRDEWLELENYLGGQAVAGGVMKDVQSGLWAKANDASNTSGFSALPAGGRGRKGYPDDVGYYATWWTSTSHDSLYAWHWGVHPDKNNTRRNPGHKASGFSVRCIKD
ncbi:MAG: fibrobacter succinogenes major paralogous domain-containing protein [Bacteroidetes bacterium]|nr:fibrobacter succinogenes major paralogous domain-containing protein [Bacteroidota bacterium]